MNGDTSVGGGVDDYLGTGLQLAVASVVTVAVLVALRVGYGIATGDGIGWSTWIALVGGLLGGTAMVTLVDRLADYDADETAIVRQLQYVHLLYVGLAGATYPWLASLVGLGDAWTRQFPEAFGGALALAVACYAVGMAVYLATGAVRADREQVHVWGILLGLYLVFGTVLGTMLSLTSFWFSLA